MTCSPAQRGFGLLEALVGVALLAVASNSLLGALNRAHAQARALHNSQRAQALLLDWLAMLQAHQTSASAPALDTYTHAFDQALPNSTDCSQRACSGEEWARFDQARWGLAVSQTLPHGRFAMQATGPRQLSIALAWLQSSALPAVPSPARASGIPCPAQHQCLQLLATP